jgi:branched-chain amino acid transport system permease protein
VLVIGGTGYLYGGLLGALAFKLASDVLSNLTPQYWHFWIGLFLVVFVLAGRDGVGVGFRRLRQRVTRSREPQREPSAELG